MFLVLSVPTLDGFRLPRLTVNKLPGKIVTPFAGVSCLKKRITAKTGETPDFAETKEQVVNALSRTHAGGLQTQIQGGQ
jgi:hypothetical protein